MASLVGRSRQLRTWNLTHCPQRRFNGDGPSLKQFGQSHRDCDRKRFDTPPLRGSTFRKPRRFCRQGRRIVPIGVRTCHSRLLRIEAGITQGHHPKSVVYFDFSRRPCHTLCTWVRPESYCWPAKIRRIGFTRNLHHFEFNAMAFCPGVLFPSNA